MRTSTRACLAAAGMLLAALLAGCGGGSVEEETEASAEAEEIQSTGEPQASGPATFLPRVLRLNFSRDPSADSVMMPVVVRIADPGGSLYFDVTRPPVLGPWRLDVAYGDRPNEYLMWLPVRTNLSVGVYTGEIRLIVCRDPVCMFVHPASGTVLPYSITVTEEFKVTVTVNGVKRDHTRRIVVRDGGKVRVTTSAPASWEEAMGGAHFGSLQKSRTSFSGTAEYGLSPSTANAQLFLTVVELRRSLQRKVVIEFSVPPPGR
jgi:hypothetical protein